MSNVTDVQQDQRSLPSEPSADPLPHQREALGDALALSDRQAHEAGQRIEEEFNRKISKLEKRYEAFRERMEARYHRRSDSARRDYEDLMRQIENVSTSDTATLTDKTQALKNQVKQESERSAREARKKLDHESWLADSVADATRENLKKEMEVLKKKVPSRRRQLDRLRAQAMWLLEAYRYPAREGDVAIEELSVRQASDADAVYEENYRLAAELVAELATLRLPRMFVGGRPWLLLILVCGLAIGAAAGLEALHLPGWPGFIWSGPIALALSALLALVFGALLRSRGRRQVAEVAEPLLRHQATAALAIDVWFEQAGQRLANQEAEAAQRRDQEVKQAKKRYEAHMEELGRRRDEALRRIEEAHRWLTQEVASRRSQAVEQVEEGQKGRLPTIEQRFARYRQWGEQWYRQAREELERQRQAARDDLAAQWRQRLDRLGTLAAESRQWNQQRFTGWDDSRWDAWSPEANHRAPVRFGTLQVQTRNWPEEARRLGGFDTQDQDVIAVPATLAFPQRSSLLLQFHDSTGMRRAIRTLQGVMARLLTTLPPGRAHFTIIDPVSLGENFAGFMHLADHDEALVSNRIWTETSHIEQRLVDLTAHMENVIQKYLRNEFETIDAYNEQAGELAEPYRFLVIANYPANFSEESARRLGSIIASGARCGVFTLIAHDTRQDLPPGLDMGDVEARSVHLRQEEGDRFVWRDEVFREFPLALEEPPGEERLTALMNVIGRAARESKRVEVPFEAIVPSDDQAWTGDSRDEVRVPIGRSGATRLQYFTLGRGMAQHALIAGKTGSGKSTLFHVMVTNLALWYRPDEIEFYLVDFKKGVEFKTYATHALPHVRAVAIESDREFGLSVLQRLDEEMERRGSLFRKHEVQDLAGYRNATGEKMPRTLLIVDEFQIFFSEDDKLAQDAAILLDRLVRQGRAFGIHVILGSQTLGGAGGLARSTIGQMAVRVALQCSEADSMLIFDDDNAAARLLSRPGEAIYNDAGGLIEGNSPFQTSWLPDTERDRHLERISQATGDQVLHDEPIIVFEGNAPARIDQNRRLLQDIQQPVARPASVKLWLGEAVAIKEPTHALLRRQGGANVMMVGQRDDAALAMMASSMISLAARHDESARFIVLDGTPADSPLAGNLEKLAPRLPQQTQFVGWREVEAALGDLAAELKQRQEQDAPEAPAIYLFIYALQRYRMFRRSEDDFSFAPADEGKPPAPDRMLAELLREGPPLGIHVMLWADAPATLERSFDRSAMREFDHRVLFQMSATDSANLIDSPAANQLGFHRAMYYSEEQGTLEKFRPYAFPDDAWLEQIASRFSERGQPKRR